MDNVRFDELKGEAATLSLLEARPFAEKMTLEERRTVASWLENQARYMLRVARYLEIRGGFGDRGDLGHQKAVQEQNRAAVKVDKALGYPHTQMITWDTDHA